MIIIKLGGSIITDKTVPLTPLRPNVVRIAKTVAKIVRDAEPVVIVHGGGSFGHYWSVRYDMHTAERSYDLKGVAVVKNSMVQLNLMVLEDLLKGGVKPYVLPPAGFMAGPRPIPSRVSGVGQIAESGMTPVTYGDAIWYGDGDKTYILSGDKIMTHLARALRPRLCIFALGEDGLYADMGSKLLIANVSTAVSARLAKGEKAGRSASSTLSASGTTTGGGEAMDVTGGMTRKVREAAAIARLGIPVAFVNGTYPRRILDAASGRKFKGTLFESHNRKREK